MFCRRGDSGLWQNSAVTVTWTLRKWMVTTSGHIPSAVLGAPVARAFHLFCSVLVARVRYVNRKIRQIFFTFCSLRGWNVEWAFIVLLLRQVRVAFVNVFVGRLCRHRVGETLLLLTSPKSKPPEFYVTSDLAFVKIICNWLKTTTMRNCFDCFCLMTLTSKASRIPPPVPKKAICNVPF